MLNRLLGALRKPVFIKIIYYLVNFDLGEGDFFEKSALQCGLNTLKVALRKGGSQKDPQIEF